MTRALAVLTTISLATSALLASPANGEPYLAVYQGMHCSSCHSHPAGGGKRNTYGNVFAQSELPSTRLGDDSASYWTGDIVDWLSVGGDLRAEYRNVDLPGGQSFDDTSISRATIYVEAAIIPNRLTLYVDQQVGPGDTVNREAYARLNSSDRRWFVMAGQFFLPYGLRLQDDSAFVRQATGINFNSIDKGVQAGFESGPWSAQLSVTNGSGGGPETDDGKQVGAIVTYLRQRWRVGASLNVNNADIGDRRMAGVFGGLRTGPVVWLAELDFVTDEIPGTTDIGAIATLLEGNWRITRGHNLKVGYEYFDPDDDISEDHRVRYSVVWEHTPFQFLQIRAGLRVYDGIPQDPSQNRDDLFVELHGFF